jgi:hypothetical protein
MRRLIIAGLVYLTGIAVILLIKPQYMFREDGRWKEFGIGRDPANFTHFPLWLFVIVWAILSYVLVAALEGSFYRELPEYEEGEIVPDRPRNNRNLRKNNGPVELTPGYYMLNERATGRNGVPRYVYLGPEEPEM